MNLISVIIPCYNGERTIKRCFESIQKQTYQNFEIIFINDGSTDNTLKIATEYAKTDVRIKVIDIGKNQGVSAARNLGILYAKGNYIQYMDADDEMLPDMMETLLDTMLKYDAQIAVSNFSGNPLFYTTFQDRLYDLTNENDMLAYYQDTFCMLLVWNKLYKREILNVRFDEEVYFAEDELFNLAVLNKVKRVACINRPLYIYHYAPAELDMEQVEEKSCMNKIIDATDNHRKNSIWYMGNDLVPRRKKILEDTLAGTLVTNIDDYLYTRVFDFYFWELSAFLYMKAEKGTIVKETLQVFQEKEFHKSIAVQEKYGLHYVKYTKEELKSYVETFVDLCVESYEQIQSKQMNVNAYEISLMLFLKLFCVPGKRRCKRYNKLYQLMMEQKENSTKEAEYFNHFMETKALEQQLNLACVDVV